MNTVKIKKAIVEAERFIKTAKVYIEPRSKFHGSGDYIVHDHAHMQSGATRRASMDLTRQLALMRKP